MQQLLPINSRSGDATFEARSLSVIIPLRANDNVDVLERLRWKSFPREVEVIVVDDGSLNASEIEDLSAELGWRYVFLRTVDAPFSLARARNAGLRAATGEFVYFEDVDFLHQSNFYHRLIHVSHRIDDTPFNFAAIPTLFLTEEASQQLVALVSDRPAFDRLFDDYLAKLPFINPDEPNDLCASFAPVGSNILLRRSLCFHVGLFDEYFNSWGGEDRDFVYRLLQHNTTLLRPTNFSDTKSWPIHRTNAYEGWRSAYRLHGDWLRSMGIYAVHIFHPDNGWKDPHARRANFNYAETKAKELEAGRRRLTPVARIDAPLSVFIGRNPVFYNDAVMQLLENVSIVEPDQNIGPEEFARTVAKLLPDRIFFQNPYGNEWLLSVWRILKADGLRCICAERGGLPWSIYFDEGGFCCDSQSYRKDLWANSVPVDAKEYLNTLRESGQFLEPQGQQSVEELADALDSQKRTILVLLQSLTDATTLHFSKPMANYTEFLEVVSGLAATGRYNVLVKNHPLNKEHPLPGVGTNVDMYPIYDLYDVADSVLTLNSGAGMLAMATGLQVVTMGTAFYAQDGLAQQAHDLPSLLAVLDGGEPVDMQCVNRFFGYLVNEFYSFADWKYGAREYSVKTRMSTMRDIRYRKIVIGELTAEVKKRPLNQYSLIMDPYALHRYITKKAAETKAQPSRSSAANALKSARAAFHAGRFAEAALLFGKLPSSGPQTLRAAAEAYDKAGATREAIKRLQEAAEIAPNNKNITRRIREMSRPKSVRWLTRKIGFPKERPYPIEKFD